MKTATIIFVALTVFSGLFLESSSAPSSLQENTVGNPSNIDGLDKNAVCIDLGDLGDLSELTETLKKLLETVLIMLKEGKNGNVVEIQRLGAFLRNLFKEIEAINAKLSGKLGDKGKDLLEKVRQIIKKVRVALKPILKELLNGLKDIASKLKANLADILENLKEVLADVKGDIKELAIRIIGLLKELLDKLRDFVYATEALLYNVTEESLDKFNILIKEVADFLAKITGLLESKGNILGTPEIKDKINRLQALIKGLVEQAEVIKTISANA